MSTMPRRAPRNITGLRGPRGVDYQSVYRVFQCGNADCATMLVLREEDVDLEAHEEACAACGFLTGPEVIKRAGRWKYCRLCGNLQPLTNFHRHRRTRSG